MASGDVAYEVTNVKVSADNTVIGTDVYGTAEQTTSFRGGTVLTPSASGSVVPAGDVVVPLRRPGVAGPDVETLFDASKYYKITITEV
jgi:hypothetical protein